MLRPFYPLALALALGGCAPPRYIYSPTVVTAADVTGIAAATYAIPASSRNGELRVYSLGIVDVRDGDTTAPAAHLRLILVNRSNETWTIEGDDQRIELEPGVDPRFVAATTAESKPAPNVTVGPKEERIVDLYFPLPEGRRTPFELLVFDALVVVRTENAIVSERVRFERFRPAPPSWTETNGHRGPPSRSTSPSRWPTPPPPQ